MRWGIGGIIAVSYAEIFFGNSLMIGLPCATVSHEDSERLIALAEAQPTLDFTLDVRAATVTAGALTLPVYFPDAVRTALLTGGWDATGQLVERYEDVDRVAASLPYVSGWGRTA